MSSHENVELFSAVSKYETNFHISEAGSEANYTGRGHLSTSSLTLSYFCHVYQI